MTQYDISNACCCQPVSYLKSNDVVTKNNLPKLRRRCSLFESVLSIPYRGREAGARQGKLPVPPSPPISRASSDPHYPPIIFHTCNIFRPNAFSDFLYVKIMSEQPDDDQILLLIHYGGKLSTKIQSPHLQLFPLSSFWPLPLANLQKREN